MNLAELPGFVTNHLVFAGDDVQKSDEVEQHCKSFLLAHLNLKSVKTVIWFSLVFNIICGFLKYFLSHSTFQTWSLWRSGCCVWRSRGWMWFSSWLSWKRWRASPPLSVSCHLPTGYDHFKHAHLFPFRCADHRVTRSPTDYYVDLCISFVPCVHALCVTLEVNMG